MGFIDDSEKIVDTIVVGIVIELWKITSSIEMEY